MVRPWDVLHPRLSQSGLTAIRKKTEWTTKMRLKAAHLPMLCSTRMLLSRLSLSSSSVKEVGINPSTMASRCWMMHGVRTRLMSSCLRRLYRWSRMTVAAKRGACDCSWRANTSFGLQSACIHDHFLAYIFFLNLLTSFKIFQL